MERGTELKKNAVTSLFDILETPKLLQDERNCWILHNLSSVSDFGDRLCGFSCSLEFHVSRWICMGRLIQELQLAPSAHGHWHAGSLWQCGRSVPYSSDVGSQ